MDERGGILREVMRTTRTSQAELSRLSGTHQPSISQILGGKISLSDDQLDRLLSCMGRRLEVVRSSVKPELTRSERRSWLLHRRLSSILTHQAFADGIPTIRRNLDRLSEGVSGQPHERNLEVWTDLIERRDLLALKRVLTGLDRHSIEMREVSPMGGLLSERQRLDVLAEAG